ncbi:Plant disease resistance response protein [Macleaya cordata]|uniref:Dirigent protein n=1 Tax=Macleaya cordata TaxID=56857 RepID=A0A200Q778_MACCD|nr:Plant disease resistance response protein [Macleaya cordata]
MGVVGVVLPNLWHVVMVLLGSQAQADREECSENPIFELGKEKVTRLHFYFHDIAGGDNPTAVRVAEAPTTNQSSTMFGSLMMVGDPLTEGPEITSKLVGRAQGLYGSAGQKEPALIMALSYVFTDAKFNGSTFNIVGRKPYTKRARELSIVGGNRVVPVCSWDCTG